MDAAAALAYEVRAGEFIQVIDVEGKQCSDFLAFNRGKLESGLERGLDATTTRSLMGHAYPMPGLQGKFYDVDQDPLIEVVRDTVGRHDTFGLACTAKYYEDKGYPGHINCSENFNGQVTPFGIAPRMGWEALNFFYNTGFDANNVFVMDEPWSRPGDYVLLRAMSDLVCASSACPDASTRRTAGRSRGSRSRVRTRQHVLGRDRTPRHGGLRPRAHARDDLPPRTSELTKSFVEYRGYWLRTASTTRARSPSTGPAARRWRSWTFSPLRKWEVLGPDARPSSARDHTRRAATLGRPGRRTRRCATRREG